MPGVVEVNIWGGEPQQFHIIVDPSKLLSFKLSMKRVFDALQRNNAIAGGGYIEHQREQLLIRGEGLGDADQRSRPRSWWLMGRAACHLYRRPAEVKEGSASGSAPPQPWAARARP